MTGADLEGGIITRGETSLISGIFGIGTLVFDPDGCMGVITETNATMGDNTDNYRVEKLFYGGNY